MLAKKIEEIKSESLAKIKKSASERELYDIKVNYLGRKGKLTEILKSLKNLEQKERRIIGPLANKARREVELNIAKRKKKFGRKYRVGKRKN